jgi:phosphoenolpyruvate carboxylase
MAHGIDDVLSVKLMARWGDLRRKSGAVPLDIAPFFETVEDLQDCGATMRALFNDPLYREHLQRRDNQQIAMVSYSDSNKDEGLAGARWSLQQAQSDLVDVLNEAGVDLILCHGRGGTISRGGGKTHAAVLGSPPGAVRGQLRATEQGELVKVKYGIRGIALRTLEQALGSVALATAFPRATLPKEAGEWHEMVDTVAAASRERYRSLVYDAPDFFRYFQLATPVELIERMQQHAGHEASRSANGASDLRAVPWDFAWTQSRHGLPGWYGFGTGLAKVIADFGLPEVQEMSRTWYFFRALLSDVETVLAKSDLNIANRYSRLAGDLHERFFPLMRGEFDLTVEKVLEIKEQQVLLEKQSTLRRSIRLRNPYVDPMSLLQVDLLKRWRESGKQDEVLFQTLVASINGIARGLQDSG